MDKDDTEFDTSPEKSVNVEENAEESDVGIVMKTRYVKIFKVFLKYFWNLFLYFLYKFCLSTPKSDGGSETKVRHLSFMLPPTQKYHISRVKQALQFS